MTPSPSDYIRGQRDGMERAAEIAEEMRRYHEAAKLTEADGIDWKSRAEKAEADLAWLALRVAQDDDRATAAKLTEAERRKAVYRQAVEAAESALAAMTERVRVLEEALAQDKANWVKLSEFYSHKKAMEQYEQDNPGPQVCIGAAAVLAEKGAPDA